MRMTVKVNVREIRRFLGPDEHVWKQFMVLTDGKEFKSMEMRCTRGGK